MSLGLGLGFKLKGYQLGLVIPKNLRITSTTATTISYAWDASAGVDGYQFGIYQDAACTVLIDLITIYGASTTTYTWDMTYYINANNFLVAAGITDTTIKQAIWKLTKDLIENNLWSKLNAVYPFVGGTATTCKFNLINPIDSDAAFRLTFNNTVSGDFTANGWQGNGVNSYANTHIAPNTLLSYDNQSYSFYNGVNSTFDPSCEMGVADSSSSGINCFLAGYLTINEFVLDNSFAPQTAVGQYLISRLNTSTKKLYVNSNSAISKTSTATNFTLSNLFINARNDFDTTVPYPSNARKQFATIGQGLTDTEAANLYTCIQTFQTSLSRNV